MDEEKIYTGIKCFNESWNVEKVISVDDYKGNYIYQAKDKDNSYIIKGFKIQLMDIENRKNSEMSKEGLEQIREIYEEYFFMKAASCLSPYIAKPLAMNYITDKYTTIEVILDCTGNTLNNIIPRTLKFLYDLIIPSAKTFSMLYQIGFKHLAIKPSHIMYNYTTNTFKLFQIRTPFIEEKLSCEDPNKKLSLNSIIVYNWVIFIYSIFPNKDIEKIKFESKKEHKEFMKSMNRCFDSIKSKVLSESIFETALRKLFISALEYEPEKRPRMRILINKMEELRASDNIRSFVPKDNLRISEFLLITPLYLKAVKRRKVRLVCEHEILKDSLIKHALKKFLKTKKYKYSYPCYKCYEVRRLKSLPLDCGCVWVDFGQKVKFTGDKNGIKYEKCENSDPLTPTDLCLLNDYISVELTATMLNDYKRESDDPILRKMFNKIINHQDINTIINILKNTKLITELNIPCSKSENTFIKSLINNKTLSILKMKNYNVSYEHAQTLALVLTSNKNLIELNLKGKRNGNASSNFILESLRINKVLKCLHLVNCYLRNEGGKAIGQMLKYNKTLIELNIKNNEITAEGGKDIASGLKYNKTLLRLDISSNKIEGIDDAFRSNNTLETLNLSSTYLHNERVYELCNTLKDNVRLKHLILKRNSIKEKGIKGIAELLEINKGLNILDLGANNFFGEERGVEIIRALRKNETLTQLNLSGWYIEPSQELLNLLRINKTLTHLNLGYSKINGQELSKGLIDNTTLISLNLEHCKLKDEGANCIFASLIDNKILTHLDISSNEICDSEVMCKLLKVNKTLTHLNIGENDQCNFNAIIKVLESNTTLTHLDLRNNNLKCDKMNIICYLLKVNTTITHLNLSRNKIDTEGAKDIIEMLKNNTTLLELKLDNNKLKFYQVKNITKAAKKNKTLKLLTLYGNEMHNFDNRGFDEQLTGVVDNTIDFSNCYN